MRLGNLNHLMTLETPTGTPNSFGEVVSAFQPAFQLWVSLEPLSQAERERAAAVQQVTTNRMTCHYQPEISGNCRFRCENRIFDIVSIVDVKELHRELQITVAEHG